MYGCESWTIKATDRNRLNAFEKNIYRRMMRISRTEHRNNNSILEELKPRHVGSWQKLKGGNYNTSVMWFELIISVRMFCMASLPETDVEEDHRDVGLTVSSNEQEHRYRMCSTRKEQKCMESHGVRVGDLRSSDMRIPLLRPCFQF